MISPGKFSIAEVKLARFTAAKNHQIEDVSLKNPVKCPPLILQSLYSFPPSLFMWFRLLPAAFMGGISMNCVGNNPTQADDRQDDLVIYAFFF